MSFLPGPGAEVLAATQTGEEGDEAGAGAVTRIQSRTTGGGRGRGNECAVLARSAENPSPARYPVCSGRGWRRLLQSIETARGVLAAQCPIVP